MAGSEQVFAATPISAAGGRVIASPFQFYTTGEDNLRILSANSLTGVSLKLQGRFIDSKGTIGAAAWDHIPNSDRSLKSSVFPLGVGAVLNLTVFASAGTPQIGQTFVIVQLVRGLGAAAIVLGTLLQGYVTSSQGLGWPGSPIVGSLDGMPPMRQIVGTTPAAGGELTEVVPTGARWQMLTFNYPFTTSAVVGSRRSYVVISDGPVTRLQAQPAGVQGPSQGFRYLWSSNMPSLYDSLNGFAQQPFPADSIMLQGQTIRTGTTFIDPADQYGAPVYTVREWLEVM